MNFFMGQWQGLKYKYPMNYPVIVTADGSKTLMDRETGECFKSQHASETEAQEVFFNPAVFQHPKWGQTLPLKILEIGFGIGTNFRFAIRQNLCLEYWSIDKTFEPAIFFNQIEPNLALKDALDKRNGHIGSLDYLLLEGLIEETLPRLQQGGKTFDVVFFDPFSPTKNPNLWSPQIFSQLFSLLAPQGRLATYSVSRIAKDSAQAAGFDVRKLPLPKILKKRSCLLAIKP